jgi:spermidine synthase
VGAIAGGIVFTYLFIPFLHSLQIVLLLSGLNLLSAALLLASSGSSTRKGWRLTPGLIVVLVLLTASLGVLLSPQAKEIQRWATSQQWAGYDLVYSQNSAYGNVAVVQRESQYTFYADGIPILTAPVPDLALSEEIVHLPLLFIRQPRRALVLSGGVGGVLHELAKYPLKQIDYAELDPLLIEAVLKFPTPLTLSELSDRRVRVEHVDGRLLVRRKTWEAASHPKEQKEGYDLVIVNLPYPSTLQLNRFYTAEFFDMVRGLLAEEGILVIGCPGTLTYMSDELRDLNAMAYHTLGQAFSHVRPIPGDLTLWLASPSNELAATPVEALVQRWEGRGLETRLLTAPHIRLRLGQRRLDWFWTHLDEEEGGGKAVINRDLHPTGLFYGLSYWNALFSPRLARVLAFTGRLNLWMLSLAIVGCGLLCLAAVKLTAKGKEAIVPIAIMTTGFTGMTADLIIVFTFQTLYGYVYHWIGLLITAFMAGLSLGGLLMTRRLAGMGRERPALLKLELAIVLYWALLPLALRALYARITHPLAFTSVQGILLLLNALAGFLVGSQFPLANRMWLKGREVAGGTAAFLGSIVVSVVLIPILGILETCLLAALLKLASLLLVVALPPRRGNGDD